MTAPIPYTRPSITDREVALATDATATGLSDCKSRSRTNGSSLGYTYLKILFHPLYKRPCWAPTICSQSKGALLQRLPSLVQRHSKTEGQLGTWPNRPGTEKQEL